MIQNLSHKLIRCFPKFRIQLRTIYLSDREWGCEFASVASCVPVELPRISLLGSSLKKETDETLFLELARRGYDLSKLRDEETTAEIVKIS